MRRRFGRKTGKKKFVFTMMVLMIMVIYTYYFTEKNIKPTILAMSEIRARLIATQAINDAVRQKTSSEAFDNLMTIKTDNSGKISLVQANAMEMNRLAAETTTAIQTKIQDISLHDLQIPITNIFGSQLFANMGPRISVDILPAGTVYVDFYTDFEEAGINQTRLKIYLIAKTDVQIIAPLVSNKVDVVTHIPVSETIIVSDVSRQKTLLLFQS
ncbi:MAG: sporulation protein YunB [Caulobacteraceae bacterium]